MNEQSRIRGCFALLALVVALLVAGCGRTAPPAPVAKTLHEAAVFYPEQIPRLVAEGAAVDAPDNDGNTALWMAARLSKVESVRLLLVAGADPNVRGSRGWTPLHCSSFCWSGSEDTEVILLLLSHGADPNSVALEFGETPLHYAVRAARSPELAQILLDAGADIDAQSDPGHDTALQFAVAQRNHELQELLLKAGASPDIRNHLGFTPQDQAPEDRTAAALFEKYANR